MNFQKLVNSKCTHIGFVLGLLFLLLILLFNFPGTWRNRVYIDINESSLFEEPKDFDVLAQILRSNSDDPWIVINAPDEEMCLGIVIDVASLNVEKTTCQVFYLVNGNGVFAESQSVSHELKQGENIIDFPV